MVPVNTNYRYGPDEIAYLFADADEIGTVAITGWIPVGYYKDEARSRSTFRLVDGVRYATPGDLAKVAEDGSLLLLGRGSAVINTGGEKVRRARQASTGRVQGASDRAGRRCDRSGAQREAGPPGPAPSGTRPNRHCPAQPVRSGL